ncbi:MAG: NAD-dependent epimerase/dehydratase family protein [Gemmatimonadota bacterium]|nr:NAD-dependent epimerase/dehydratase family protein [Gemmatimonadota bacterium]
MSPGRVLVTGGAGFIGSHVCDHYLADGWDVTALDDLSSGRRENVPVGAELVELDVRDPSVRDVFAERRFDVVNHHAAQIDVRTSVSNPWLDASINLGGLLNLLGNSVAFGVSRFVFISSGGVVYGEPDVLPTPRTAPKQPLSPYGVSKLGSEFYLRAFRELHGLEYVALRYSNVYGPRQDPHGEAGVVAIFSQRLRAGDPLTVFGDGEQTRDYVFVRDVAEANILATRVDLPAGGDLDTVAFNIGVGTETSVNELAAILMDISGSRVDVEHAAARPGELLRSCLDTSDTAAALGWAPRHSLVDGLRETYEAIAGAVG